MHRRKWYSKDKFTIVLEELKEGVPLVELCAKFQISRSQYYKWRDQLLANGEKVLYSIRLAIATASKCGLRTQTVSELLGIEE